MLIIRRVVGQSMQPTLPPGTVAVGWKLKRPRLGDIVIAKPKDREVIKRVFKISSAGYFLLGDNSAYSTDSRTFGWLTKRQIIAVVICTAKYRFLSGRTSKSDSGGVRAGQPLKIA